MGSPGPVESLHHMNELTGHVMWPSTTYIEISTRVAICQVVSVPDGLTNVEGNPCVALTEERRAAMKTRRLNAKVSLKCMV
jgi:hypothetical protein